MGNNVEGQPRFIDKLLRDISYVPGTADLRIQQPFNNPHFTVNVDRSKAQDIGLTQRDVAGSLLVALEWQLPDHADLLAEPAKWGQLQHRCAIATI